MACACGSVLPSAGTSQRRGLVVHERRRRPAARPVRAGPAVFYSDEVPVVESATLDSTDAVHMASLSRAMYQSGAAIGSQSMRVSRGSMGLGSSAAPGGGGTRPIAPAISSAVVIGITVGTAVIAAVRSKIKSVRECTVCQGYGVQRCRLCSGKGTIDWEGKMAHREPCPMCLGRRLHKCTACGGGILLSRSLFNHKANKGEAALMETLQTLATPGSAGGRLGLRNLLFGKRQDEDERLLASDEYANEIITD